MCLEARRQSGFALFTAIFILVLMALLSAGMASLFVSSQTASALDMESAQARQAARAGVEWGLNKVWQGESGTMCSTAGTTGNFTDTLAGGFSVTVHCLQRSVPQAGESKTHYEITAWACNRPKTPGPACPGDATAIAGGHYIERKSFALIEN